MNECKRKSVALPLFSTQLQVSNSKYESDCYTYNLLYSGYNPL